MIIHKLIAHHLAHKDDPAFYTLQADDAIQWIEQSGVSLTPQTEVLDLGAGHGIFGAQLLKRNCRVTFADAANSLLPGLQFQRFLKVDLDLDDIKTLGAYDLVICSNVLEHLSKPFKFIHSIEHLLTPSGRFYLSWTNWLSPWGGHEFSPFHYFGAKRGHLIYDKITGRQRLHTPYVNLFPTSIGQTVRIIRDHPKLRLLRAAPRYYPELSFLLRVPVLREFITWNCSLLIARR